MAGAGFYGKLPSEGDFVTRRLPWAFTAAWDDWLQQGLLASRQALGADWLARYLSAPLWRFRLAPGVCGPAGWRGVFFPSVDRVGRYFPLTIAFADDAARLDGAGEGDADVASAADGAASPTAVPAAAADLVLAALANDAWLVVEDAALAALAPTLALADFDRTMGALAPPPGSPLPAPASPARACFHCAATPEAPSRSLSFAALPPPHAFVQMLAPPPASSAAPADIA